MTDKAMPDNLEKIKEQMEMLRKMQNRPDVVRSMIVNQPIDTIRDATKEMDAVTDGPEYLAMAIGAGRLDCVQLFLDKGVSLDNPPQTLSGHPGMTNEQKIGYENYRKTPYLVMAAMAGDPKIFQAIQKVTVGTLFQEGPICLSKKRKNAVTGNVISAAAYYGHKEMMQYLLKLAQSSLTDQVNYLCKESLDPVKGKGGYQAEFEGFNPLMLAAVSERANPDVIQLLITAGVERHHRIKSSSDNALHLCTRYCPSTQIVSFLIAQLPEELLYEYNKKGETPLSICQGIKDKDFLAQLEQIQKQHDKSQSKTDDLLMMLEAEKAKEEKERQKRKEKKYNQKLKKLSERDNVTVEETQKRLQEEKKRKAEEAALEDQRQREKEEREERRLIEEAKAKAKALEDRKAYERQLQEEAKRQKAQERALQKEKQMQKMREEAAERSVGRKPAQEEAPKQNKAARRAEQQRERRLRSEAPPQSRETPADDEVVEVEDTVSKNPENQLGQAAPVGFNGKMALDMLSKKKKKQLKKELEADERAEKELRERILQKKAEEAKEAERVRKEAEKKERQEAKREKQELKKAAEQAQKEKEEAEAAKKEKKAKKAAKKPEEPKAAQNLVKEPHALDELFGEQQRPATFQGGAGTRQQARAKSIGQKENAQSTGNLVAKAEAPKEDKKAVKQMYKPKSQAVVEPAPAQEEEVAQQPAAVEEKKSARKERPKKEKKRPDPVEQAPVSDDVAKLQQALMEEQARSQQQQLMIEQLQNQVDDLAAENVLLKTTAQVSQSSGNANVAELQAAVKKAEAAHETQMKVNKGLAEKVINFERQIMLETKKRQDLERRLASAGVGAQPHLVNLNNNRVNNYS